MNPLVFDTGLPFGVAIFAILLLLAMLVGLALAAWGLRTRRAGRAISGVALMGVGVVVAGINIVEADALDPNPLVTAAELVGPWRDGAATLVVGVDGRYECSGSEGCNGFGVAGRWERVGDFELALRPDDIAHAEQVRRVVAYRGSLRLTEMPYLDDWDGRLTFEHTQSSAKQ